MNIFDIIIVALLLFAFVRGIMKGFFAEVASLVAIIAGVFVAIHYAHHMEYYLVNSSAINWSDETNRIVSFAVTFLFVVILVIFIGKILTKIADITALGMLNKLLGGIFGGLKIALILSVIFTFFGSVNNTIPFVEKETLDESVMYNPVKKIAPALFPSIIKEGEEGESKIDFSIK
ncbi:membrane protein required for colicin V production [Polaribacter sp. KT25b]|uniref:CvpA family protein n=1 Tax=Polaribacter sp. KT25b TaxID=1855336 RepID=UPI00087AE7B3|nr:CvpA family protein [Polaribacter sp. KT25b]SDS56383.1 membrane protein required for colicin V production [Polaribacter sp. KT25b]